MSDYIDSKDGKQESREPGLTPGGLNAEGSKPTPAMIEKFVIRLPKGLRNKIKHLSEQNRRSMNSEIIMVLEQHIQQNLADQAAVLEADFSASFANQEQELSGDEDRTDVLQRPSDTELTRRLENLPEEKKQALLELLG